MGLLAFAVVVVAIVAPGVLAGASPAANSALALSNPAWSPDGAHIAFASHVDGHPLGRLVVADASGSHAHTVYSSRAACCGPIQWASSTLVVFVDDYQLKSLNLETGRILRLASNAPDFTFSPNRQTVAFINGCACGHAADAIGITSSDRRGVRLISKPKGATDTIDGFSPDGTQLVFTRAPFAANGNTTAGPALMSQALRGGAPVPLSHSGIIGSSLIPSGAQGVEWSPDGRWIAYISARGLEIVSTSGGKRRLLVPASPLESAWLTSYAWSPKSTEIAYPAASKSATGSGVLTRLATITVSGKAHLLWTSSLDWVSLFTGQQPAWSPDGSRLIFAGKTSLRSEASGIYEVAADGGSLRRLH
jgi:Tol biopolymer transport system component